MPKPVYSADPVFARGDIWEFHKRKYWVCVPTNIGWTNKGLNVMGAGIAQQAARKFIDLPKWYGRLCKMYKDKVDICFYSPSRLIMVPVKPLNHKSPHLSWQGKASLELIEQSLISLMHCLETDNIKPIAIPLLGCGNGKLQPSKVKPLLKKYLDDRFTIVQYS